jgi:hypothetical protein
MARCVYCNGTGRVSANAQPGYKVNAVWSMVDCRHCGGSGGDDRAVGGAAPRVKAHPVVWLFAILGGIFGAALSEVGVNVLVGAVGGFVVLGAIAGVLMRFRVGRRILIGIGVLFAALLALGAFLSN